MKYQYLIGFLFSVALVYLLTPKTREWDGVSIYLTAVVASLLLLGFEMKLLGILVGGTMVFLLGWCEERKDIHPLLRILWLIIPAVVVYVFGVRIDFITHPFGEFIYLGRLSFWTTLLWVTSVTSLVSLTNRLDGLTCCVTLITSLFFFVVAQNQRSELVLASALSVIVAGCVLGFLKFNFHPAEVSIGKSGSMFLGFVLSVLAIIGVSKSTALFLLFLPILLSITPILLVATSILYCYLRGPSFSAVPSLNLAWRMTTPQAALLVSFTCLGLGVITTSFLLSSFVISALLSLTGLLAFFFLGGRLLFEKRGYSPVLLEESPKQISILGVKIDRFGFEEALRRIEEFIKSGKPHTVVTLNPLSLLEAKKDREIEEVLEEADLVVPDGIGLLWAAEFYGTPLTERVTGIDLLKGICKISAQKGYRAALFGAKMGVADEAARELQKEYPGLSIVGIHHGYLRSSDDEEKLIQKLREESPDVLFVGLGVPYQERWIKRYVDKLEIPVMMGVGGSFDVIAERLKRAPAWMAKRGLEWLYRLYLQPWRIKRIFNIPYFVFEVFIHKIKLNDESVLVPTTSP